MVDGRGDAERWFAALVEHADDAILSKTLDGVVLTWNAAAEQLYGWPAGEIVGRNVSLIVPDDRAEELERILARLARGERVDRLLTKRVTRDGRMLDVSLSISPVRDGDGTVVGAATITRDITRDLLLVEELRQAQKMEAIGRLAGGIAHDFNNLLTGITGYGRLARDLDDPAEVRRALDQIVRAGERAAELTQRLLLFSRRQAHAPRVVDVNHAVRDLQPMLTRLIGEDVELLTFLADGVEPVVTDPSELEQVLLNLVVNARDAMPDGGRLTIETANVELDAAYAAAHEHVTPGRYVLVAVTDTGVGMDAETRQRLFEPFFTTKPRGTGTGLGLSTVYGIVERAGGHIWFYSEPGHGAVFKIYLPQAAGRRAERDGDGAAPPPPSGSERVLLVEDEDVVRELATLLLTRAGYRVDAFATPLEALAAWEVADGGYDALVSDVVLPQLSGPELFQRLDAPRLPVVFMSGYTGETVVHHGLIDRDEAFVGKPFTPETLLVAVRRALDRAR